MAYLSSKEILALRSREVVDAEVPQLGGSVRLLQLSQGGADRFGALWKRQQAGEPVSKDLFIFLLTEVMVNEKKAPMFTKAEAESLYEQLSLEKTTGLTKAVVEKMPELLPQMPESELGNSAGSPTAA